jgi:hypothetical protein
MLVSAKLIIEGFCFFRSVRRHLLKRLARPELPLGQVGHDPNVLLFALKLVQSDV